MKHDMNLINDLLKEFGIIGIIGHIKLKCLTHKMINFKFEPF